MNAVPKTPRILFVPTTNSGTAYWRMWNFAKAIHATGKAKTELFYWKWDFNNINDWEQYLANNPNNGHSVMLDNGLNEFWGMADAIVVQYLHFTQTLCKVRELRDRYPNKPIFCEIDDNMLSVPDYNGCGETYAPGSKNRAVILKQMEEADGVICSTPYLAELYEDYNENTHVIHNCIDFDTWGKLERYKRNGSIVIGWAGGATHSKDLECIIPIIKDILEKHKNVQFEFVGGIPAAFDGIPNVTVIRDWKRIDEYPAYIASRGWHIGLASLLDNGFNRGKSNLRWLELSALGIPCVAFINTQNPGHTHFHQTIEQFKDGIVANNLKELETALDTLINDRSKRINLGINALERVKKDFNASLVAQTYLDTINAAISDKLNEDNDDEPRNPSDADQQSCGGPKPDPIHSGSV